MYTSRTVSAGTQIYHVCGDEVTQYSAGHLLGDLPDVCKLFSLLLCLHSSMMSVEGMSGDPEEEQESQQEVGAGHQEVQQGDGGLQG